MKKQRGGNVTLGESELYEDPVMDRPLPSAEPEFFSGGAKKKSAAKKAPAKKPVAASAKKPASKKGGSLAEDVKSLAVPFAILLAKEGLNSMFHNKKQEKKPAMAATVGSRRKAAVGGAPCGSCSGAKMGGKASSTKSRYAQLSKEIDNFLQRYP